jgi:hypothetical protein
MLESSDVQAMESIVQPVLAQGMEVESGEIV